MVDDVFKGVQEKQVVFDAPTVSVLIPCRNEVDHIGECIERVFQYDPPENGFEVILIDGMSDDGTRDVIELKKQKYPQLRILDNPKMTAPCALNLGIQASRGTYIIRNDVRCIHPQDYLVRLVELSEKTGAVNVGGVIVPIGNDYIQRSIAVAYNSPIAMGDALRNRAGYCGPAGAVYGGCYKRDVLIKAGCFDEEMARNEDDELSFRLRKGGGKIYQSSDIKVFYFPRKKWGHLYKQFMQYGFWKAYVFQRHPRMMSIKQFIPSLFVFFLFFLVISAVIFPRYSSFLILYVMVYAFSILAESFRLGLKNGLKFIPGIFVSISVIHFAYGIGFVSGIISLIRRRKPKWCASITR